MQRPVFSSAVEAVWSLPLPSRAENLLINIYRQGQLKLDRSLGVGGPIRFHFELISSSLRLHFDFTSVYFDSTLISL